MSVLIVCEYVLIAVICLMCLAFVVILGKSHLTRHKLSKRLEKEIAWYIEVYGTIKRLSLQDTISENDFENAYGDYRLTMESLYDIACVAKDCGSVEMLNICRTMTKDLERAWDIVTRYIPVRNEIINPVLDVKHTL